MKDCSHNWTAVGENGKYLCTSCGVYEWVRDGGLVSGMTVAMTSRGPRIVSLGVQLGSDADRIIALERRIRRLRALADGYREHYIKEDKAWDIGVDVGIKHARARIVAKLRARAETFRTASELSEPKKRVVFSAIGSAYLREADEIERGE